MIVIIDYKAGNLGSIKNMLSKVGAEGILSSDPEVISEATKLILPGIGSFDFGVSKLRELGIWEVLNKKVLEQGTPILGVCLGAQLFCRRSEEGVLPGLGWIDADVVKFPATANGNKLRVPHIGWDVVQNAKTSKLWKDMPDDSRFYFVHSYCIQCSNANDILSANHYGIGYHSAVERNNIIGVQFHPEKSHKYGLVVYKNFVEHY